MKKIVITLALFVVVLSSCKKEFDDQKDQDNQINFNDLKVNSQFDWKLTDNITFNITSQIAAIIRITSIDEKLVYYKGNHQGNNFTENLQISIPKSITAVLVNGNQVMLGSHSIDVNLGNFKAVATTNMAVNFNGTNAYCEIQDISSLNGANAFTVEAWVKQVNTADYARLFHKFAGHAQDISIATYMSKLYVEVGNGANSFAYWPDYATTIPNDTWYHIAAVYDGTQGIPNDRIKLYINGNPVSLTFNGTIPGTTYSFTPGTYQFLSWDQKLGGKMDEVRIWNYSRTQTEINNDMNTTLAGTEAGFLAYYKFDALNFGFKCPDASGHHSDAMLFGGFSLSTDVPFSYVADSDGDGVPDPDDDYPNDPDRAFDNYFPAEGYGSLGYEDLWPGKGDYDFNDIVVDYRFHTVTNASNKVVEIFSTFPVKASGAYLHNGFGFNLPDANAEFTSNPQKLLVSGYDLQEGIISLNAYGHENGQTHPTLFVFDNIFNILQHPGIGTGVNTEESAPFVNYDTLTLTITTPGSAFTQADFSLVTWNPFIIVDKTRSHEIHLPDYEPTDLMDTDLFGQWEDDSNPLTDRYYKTGHNLPWAINIPASYEWPVEKTEIIYAYLHFAEWAESSGTLYSNWYEDIGGYRDASKIYTP